MDNKKRIIIIAGAAIFLIVLIVIGVLVFGNKGGNTQQKPIDNSIDCTKNPENEACKKINIDKNKEVGLTIWGVYDDNTSFQEALKSFNKIYPNIKITYLKKQYADYEQILVDAIASDSAPDIFAMENTWLPKHKAKISPAPNSVISSEEFSEKFTSAAYDDFVTDNKVYALPAYMDNLMLYYNKKIFNDNYIYDIPETWGEVLAISQKLTKKSSSGQISQSGISLGTSNNISRANDILLAMMIQTNTPIISQDKKSFTFNQFRKDESNQPYYPGENALKYYTNFADPSSSAYSWDSSLENNVASFAHGNVAMMVGYNYFANQIATINPKLSYGTANFPQIDINKKDQQATLANYWGYTVSRNSKNSGYAWLFLNYLLNGEGLDSYLQATGKTSALNKVTSGNIINQQKGITKTIYKGNGIKFDTIFNEMIDDVSKYKQKPLTALDTANRKANEIILAE